MFYFPSTQRSHLKFNLTNFKMTIKTLKKRYFQNMCVQRKSKWTLNLRDGYTI